MERRLLLACSVLLAATFGSGAEESSKMMSETFNGLTLRSIGPALTSGRIGDIAVHRKYPKIYYVAAASGGVWKTENSGTTWTPVFDGEKSFSIGTIASDPNDPLVVWVGTGENNSQRSVSYGDGVWKTTSRPSRRSSTTRGLRGHPGAFRNGGDRSAETLSRGTPISPRNSFTGNDVPARAPWR